MAEVTQISKEMAHLQQLAADFNRRAEEQTITSGDAHGVAAPGASSPGSPPAAVATGVEGGAPDLEQVRL